MSDVMRPVVEVHSEECWSENRGRSQIRGFSPQRILRDLVARKN